MNKLRNTSNPRGAPVATSAIKRRGRGGSPQTYRLTGRDGPSGLKLIRGAPARLEEDRSRKSEVGSQQPSARGKPHTKPVISTRYEERTATEKLKSNRFLPALGMTRGFRGKTHTKPVISTRYESLSRDSGKRSVTAELEGNRFLPRGLGVVMTLGCRGNQPQNGRILSIGQNAFNRENYALLEAREAKSGLFELLVYL